MVLFSKICDVTLRDGIQNLKRKSGMQLFGVNDKINIIERLLKSDIQNIEFGSNVSHKITEMKNTSDVIKELSYFPVKPKLYLLVPSYKKFMETKTWNEINKVTHLSLITASSETFIRKNTNMSITENFQDIHNIIKNTDLNCRIYISTCFGCPFEGTLNKTHQQNIDSVFELFVDNPKVKEIVISDTIGNYSLEQVNDYMKNYGATKKVSLHIHSDEMDSNIPKLLSKHLDELVSVDTSLGNVGGCPTVDKKIVKPNLSTLRVATIINQLTKEQIYDLEQLQQVEQLVRDIIQGNHNLL